MTEEQKKRVPCNLSLTLSAIEPYLKAGKNILRVGKKELRIALALQKEINQ